MFAVLLAQCMVYRYGEELFESERMEMWNVLVSVVAVHLRYFNFILIFCSRLPIFEAGKHENQAGNGVKVAKGKMPTYGGASETTTFCAVCGNLVFVFFSK